MKFALGRISRQGKLQSSGCRWKQSIEAINSLARMAEPHEGRLDDLEQG
jgi:hypothetical protein